MLSVHDHGDKSNALPCSHCGKVYYEAYQLERHVLAKHSGKVWECSECSKTFLYEHSYTRHIAVMHAAPGTMFTCVCGESFPTYWKRDQHRRYKCTRYKSQHDIRKEVAQVSIDCVPTTDGADIEHVLKTPNVTNYRGHIDREELT